EWLGLAAADADFEERGEPNAGDEIALSPFSLGLKPHLVCACLLVVGRAIDGLFDARSFFAEQFSHGFEGKARTLARKSGSRKTSDARVSVGSLFFAFDGRLDRM